MEKIKMHQNSESTKIKNAKKFLLWVAFVVVLVLTLITIMGYRNTQKVVRASQKLHKGEHGVYGK